jgi:hypothetical protein
MNNDWCTVEESAELLRRIFPNFPDLIGMKAAPDVRQFLVEYRAAKQA